MSRPFKQTCRSLEESNKQIMKLCSPSNRPHFSPLELCIWVVIWFASCPLEAVAEPAPSNKPRAIVCLGDSLTAGYGLDPTQAYPALLQKNIDSLGWRFKVVNAGLSGETTAGGLRRLDWILKRPIDVLVLALGGNDALRGIPLETTRQNLDRILAQTRAKVPGVHLVVAGMLVPPNWGREYFNGFRSLFPQLAKQHRAGLVPFLLEGVGGKPELNSPDGIHPTAEGHRIIAANVWKVLEPLLRSIP